MHLSAFHQESRQTTWLQVRDGYLSDLCELEHV